MNKWVKKNRNFIFLLVLSAATIFFGGAAVDGILIIVIISDIIILLAYKIITALMIMMSIISSSFNKDSTENNTENKNIDYATLYNFNFLGSLTIAVGLFFVILYSRTIFVNNKKMIIDTIISCAYENRCSSTISGIKIEKSSYAIKLKNGTMVNLVLVRSGMLISSFKTYSDDGGKCVTIYRVNSLISGDLIRGKDMPERCISSR
jgi:hypothetical protein